MLNQLFFNRFTELKFERYDHTSVNPTLFLCGLLHNRDTIVAYYASWKAISPSNLYLMVIFQIIIKGDAHT